MSQHQMPVGLDEGTQQIDLQTVPSSSERLLTTVVENRNKRKAKDIVSTTFEFILAVISIIVFLYVSEANDLLDFEEGLSGTVLEVDELTGNRSIHTGLSCVYWSNTTCWALLPSNSDYYGIPLYNTIFAGALIIYVCMVATFVMLHSRRLPAGECHTTEEVEAAYSKTNSKPFVDGILELRLGLRFGGKRCVLLVWAIAALSLAGVIAILVKSSIWAPDAFASVMLTIFTFYRLTADVCEYWVYTRESNMVKKGDPQQSRNSDASLAIENDTGAKNDEDKEAPAVFSDEEIPSMLGVSSKSFVVVPGDADACQPYGNCAAGDAEPAIKRQTSNHRLGPPHHRGTGLDQPERDNDQPWDLMKTSSRPQLVDHGLFSKPSPSRHATLDNIDPRPTDGTDTQLEKKEVEKREREQEDK